MKTLVPVLVIAAALLACRAPAAAPRVLDVKSGARGSLSKELVEVIHRMDARGDTRLAIGPDASAVECMEVSEVRETFVCVFNTARFMNAALNRASEFVEVERRVLTDREHVENRANDTAEGHDLRGEDLRAFDRAWSDARKKFEPVASEDGQAILAIERDFWEAFLRPRLKASPDLVLLAVASGTDIGGTLSHEIVHAQYFRSEAMRTAVAEYWKTALTDAEKEQVKSALAASYDVTNADLLVNEFQAYVLMHGAEAFELAVIAKTHREPLEKKLAAVGVKPIQLRLPE